jgi:hypothetical protein
MNPKQSREGDVIGLLPVLSGKEQLPGSHEYGPDAWCFRHKSEGGWVATEIPNDE